MRFLRWLAFGLIVPVVIVALWTFFAETFPSLYWPSPIKIAGAFWPTWFEGRLTSDVLPSLFRLLVGYLIALVAGILLGLLVGSLRRLRMLLEPVFEFFRAVPPPVLVPIVMLFTGLGQNMQLAVIAIGAVWPILLNTIEGVRGLDLTQLDTARSYRISGWRRFVSVVLPGAAPKIVAGARQALSVAIIMMVISEMFASTDGIGVNVLEFQRLFRFAEMWTGIVLLGIIGVVANFLFKFAERRILRWYVGMQSQER